MRLMASTCRPWTAATASSKVAELPSSLPSDSSTSTLLLDRRREVLAGGDHDVVERCVAAGDDRVDVVG